jgi:hypothetical protein
MVHFARKRLAEAMPLRVRPGRWAALLVMCQRPSDMIRFWQVVTQG